MNDRVSSLAPNLVVGLGILVSTLVAALVGGSMPLALLAPLLLGLAGGLARWIVDRAEGQTSLSASLFTVLYATGCGAIVALIAPERLSLILPILGVGVWAVAARRSWCWPRRLAR